MTATTDILDVLSDVLELFQTPVYVKDREHRWVAMNSSFCAFMGHEQSFLIGKSDYDFSPKEQADVFWAEDRKVFETRAPNMNTEKNSTSDGKPRWVESQKSYYRAPDGGEYIIGILTDITELKLREEALSIAEKRAVAGSQAKSEFLANMSHEIRTPMNGVLGMAQILKTTPLDASQREMVDTLVRSGDALLTIINDILDFSKMEAGKFEIDPAPFNLRDAIDDVAMLLRANASEKDIELVVDAQADLPETVIGDAGRLRQILLNLTGNAIKFTHEGYVMMRVRSDVSGPHLNLRFDIEDTGIGIPADKVDKIFNTFEQADGSTTRQYGGTGLGLAITRSLVEIMGGQVSVTSEPGKGSVFSFNAQLSHDSGLVAPQEPKIAPDILKGRRVLIVDDLEPNRDILAAQLTALGAQPETASSARDAVSAIVSAHNAGARFDLIVTDYQMPGVDGLTMVKALRDRAEFANLKIIALSSVDSSEVKASFEEAAVAAYLVKPVKKGALEQAIAETLSGNEAQRAEVSRKVAEVNRQRISSDANSPRILVADDNDANRDVVKYMLQPLGYQLDFARNGKIALELFKRAEYDLVLMDLSMPVMDGVAATLAIRSYEAEIGAARSPVIALTAHIGSEAQATATQADMDDFITKPIDPALLETKIGQFLAIAEAKSA